MVQDNEAISSSEAQEVLKSVHETQKMAKNMKRPPLVLFWIWNVLMGVAVYGGVINYSIFETSKALDTVRGLSALFLLISCTVWLIFSFMRGIKIKMIKPSKDTREFHYVVGTSLMLLLLSSIFTGTYFYNKTEFVLIPIAVAFLHMFLFAYFTIRKPVVYWI